MLLNRTDYKCSFLLLYNVHKKPRPQLHEVPTIGITTEIHIHTTYKEKETLFHSLKSFVVHDTMEKKLQPTYSIAINKQANQHKQHCES